MATAKKDTNLFKNMLTRKSSELEKETADIISREVKSEYDDILKKQVKEIDSLTMKLKKKKNINISNNLQDASRIDDKEFDGAAWAQEYEKLTQELTLRKAAIRVSDKNYKELFGVSYLEKEGIVVGDE